MSGDPREKRWTTSNERLMRYMELVESIQNGVTLPWIWRYHRKWLRTMPVAKMKSAANRGVPYYKDRFGYIKDGDVYKIDNKCVGAICTVVILAWGNMSACRIAKATGLRDRTVEAILKNYKYYVGWHNAYTEDGRRIWPAIKEIALIHKDMTGEEVLEAKQDVIVCESLDK